MNGNVIDVLKERGFIDAITNEDIRQITEKPIKVYCGFDPTADSLHIGNLIAIMGLAWFQRFGHTPVAIVGGATGMIGDPSGKNAERNLLDENTINQNLKGITKNLTTILDTPQNSCKVIILNNLDWFKNFSLISFLRDVGKLFRMGIMLSKDSVKTRLESEEGLSFTEFCYQTLQGYDFLHLYNEHDVKIQLGGSDQWGNITAGIDLIRRVHGKSAFGITFPLLTKSDGTKFGKSEKGALWLSPEKLSPYEFYQYLIRVEDNDVIKLLKMLTFIDINEINEYEQMMKSDDYIPRTAQKRLAEEVTRIVHGEDALKTAIKVTQNIAPGAETRLDAEMLESLAKDMPSMEFSLQNIINVKLIDLMVETRLQTSKGDARKLIRNGGVYINNQKIEDENIVLTSDHLISNRLILLSAGKKNKLLIRVKS